MSEHLPRPRVIPGHFAAARPARAQTATPAACPQAPEPRPAAEPEAGTTFDLVERAKHGDQLAWEILVSRYRAPLTRFAQARLARQAGHVADTDDVVQDVTVNVFRRLHSIELRFPGALLAYLRRAVTNRIADAHRRVMRQGPTASLHDDYPDPQRSPMDFAMDNEKVRLFRAALLTLGADDRVAIVMRLERGASYDAIAERLGKPTANAARVAVARAMYKLARRMGPPLEAARRAAESDSDNDDPPAAVAVGR